MPEKTTEPGRKPAKKHRPEVVEQIPFLDLYPFPDHPFQVRDDDAMQETAESIKTYGVLVPALARPREDGGYELIAGHRRKHACELAGLTTMPDKLFVCPLFLYPNRRRLPCISTPLSIARRM